MKSIRRVLIIQPYGIGDALFTTPLLRALRLLPSVESVDLLLGSRTGSVFRNNPHVDRIFSIDKNRWRSLKKKDWCGELFQLWKDLKGRYDLLIDFSLQREYGFYSGLLLGIPRRIGFDFKGRGTFLTHTVPLPNGFEGGHVIDFYCELGKRIGLDVEVRHPEFYLSREDEEKADLLNLPKSFICVAPGGGESWGKDSVFKRWPVSSFVQMLSLIKKRLDLEAVVILGSGGERGLGDEMEEQCRAPVFNFCGQFSLGASAAVLKKSQLFLANDGGLIHLAHALHVPLIGLYGPADPRVYGPYPPRSRAVALMREKLPCRPCYSRFRYNSACADRECLTAFSPEEAMEILEAQNLWPRLCKNF